PILKLEGDAKPSSSSEVSGLDWDYAMMWSNGWLDCAASLIPGVAGGGTGEYVGESSAFYKGLQRLGARLDGRVQAPLYWGSLPFTSGPSYFGAAIIFLFMASLIWVKGPIKWWLLSGVVLTFVLSMGKNIAFINHPLFDYLPLLNKFRTPNSVLTVTSFLVPLLAFLGLSKVLSGELSKDEIMRGVLIGGGVSGGLCLFFALLGPSMFDPATARDMGSVSRILGGQADQAMLQEFVKNVHADRLSLMRTDAFRSFLLIALTAGLVWALANKKIKEMVFLIGLGAIVLFDCWSVGKRYLNEESFVSTRQYEDNFQPRPVDSEILKDTDPNYRVLDLSVSTYQSARTSYFHKTIGGYHPAKLQRYEDIVQRHLIKGNPKVVNMLNTKYVITPQSQAQRNSEALGNAWFVSNIKMVQDANAEIDALDNIDPGEEAAIHQDFNDYIAGFQPQKGGTIQLTSYEPDHLTYASNASSEQLAVFSEVWYGPDKGWQAYINQQPVDHIRANYVLRAMKVPAGQHVIEFKFEPSSFYIGENISLIASLLIILGLIAFIYKEFSEFKPEEVVETAPKVVKKTKSPTVSKVKKTGSSKKKKKK
ncbi:MAG: YfhO family protein, partial [Bacteroidota bacterium]